MSGPLFATNDVEATIFRAVESILRADPVLGSIVQTWRTWTGEPDDSAPPTTAQMPWLQLTPSGGRIQLMEVDSYQEIVAIRIAFAVPGTRADDRLNFWSALRRALSKDAPYQDTTVHRYLRLQGATIVMWGEPAFGLLRAGGDTTPLYDQLTAAQLILKPFVPA